MFTRLLTAPKHSALLLGPRGTGKSTWMDHQISPVRSYDLLVNSEVLRLSKNPSLLGLELETLKAGSWVTIDEVQKVPSLLDEVHRLIERKKINFLLSGSSARKLKKGGANLLAGRAEILHLFPLVSEELNHQFEIETVISQGLLPLAVTRKPSHDFLRSYAETYLKEEIQNEALTRNLGSFARFLEIAARQNAQITNVSNISRDARVARQTVIGSWLPAWKVKRATKQVSHPKFYFFDTGVVRALSGRIPYPCTSEESGSLLETWILNEIKAYMSYRKLHYPVYFWSSHDGVEVDIFFECKKGFVGIEIKHSARWEKKFSNGLFRISTELPKNKIRLYGVFNGPRTLKIDDITVFTVKDFLKKLWSDDLFR
jgi:uncharacterized protein